MIINTFHVWLLNQHTMYYHHTATISASADSCCLETLENNRCVRPPRLTWLGVDDHLLPRVGGREGAAVGHVLAGSELQHLHQAQGNAPLEEEALVQLGGAAATAVLTPADGSHSFRGC